MADRWIAKFKKDAVPKLVKEFKPKKVKIFVAEKWKYELFQNICPSGIFIKEYYDYRSK